MQTHVIFENERKEKSRSIVTGKFALYALLLLNGSCIVSNMRFSRNGRHFVLFLVSPYEQAAVPLAAYDEPALRALPPPSSCSLLNSSPSPPQQQQQQQQHSLFSAVEMPAPPRPFTDPATAATAVAGQHHHHHHRADQAAYRQDVITC